MGDRERDDRSMLGDAPTTGGPGGELDDVLDRCKNERETMTSKETADCAGIALAEQYENEEDGGS